jgi:oligopeptide transport system substrate-binding protein
MRAVRSPVASSRFPTKIEKTPQPRPDSQPILHILDQATDGLKMNSLDPATAYYRTELQITQLVFPSLVTLDAREQPVDWAAASHDVSGDGLTYAFPLRPKLHWSDGTAVDAATFAYFINRGLDSCLDSRSSFFLYLSAIKGSKQFYNEACPLNASSAPASLISASLRTPDPLTLRILLDHPSGGFLVALAYPPAFAVPKHLVEKYRFGDERVDHLALAADGGFGGNLYKLTSLDDQGHITLTRNDAFWAPPSQKYSVSSRPCITRRSPPGLTTRKAMVTSSIHPRRNSTKRVRAKDSTRFRRRP